MAMAEIEGFLVRWAELEDIYLRETQSNTKCLGLIGPENPNMQLL